MRTGRKSQAQKVFDELGRIENILEDFHNHHSAEHLVNGNKELRKEYIQQVIKQFRLLEAYSTEGKRAIYPFANGKNINAKNIDRILRGISVKCVDSFSHRMLTYGLRTAGLLIKIRMQLILLKILERKSTN